MSRSSSCTLGPHPIKFFIPSCDHVDPRKFIELQQASEQTQQQNVVREVSSFAVALANDVGILNAGAFYMGLLADPETGWDAGNRGASLLGPLFSSPSSPSDPARHLSRWVAGPSATAGSPPFNSCLKTLMKCCYGGIRSYWSTEIDDVLQV